MVAICALLFCFVEIVPAGPVKKCSVRGKRFLLEWMIEVYRIATEILRKIMKKKGDNETKSLEKSLPAKTINLILKEIGTEEV